MRIGIIMLAGIWIGLLLPGDQAVSQTAQLRAEELQCEYRTGPLGIDIANPRLSWIVSSDQRNQKQTACRILVASSSELLNQDKGDLWDSGKIEGDNTTAAVYSGKPLQSNMKCFWKVRVWDRQGDASEWSKPAFWTMGLLDPKDWKAQWIGLDDIGGPYARTAPQSQEIPEEIRRAYWIWSCPNSTGAVPVGRSFFRRMFQVPADWKIKSAECVFTADNACEVFLNGRSLKTADNFKILTSVSLVEQLRPGKNVLAVSALNRGGQDNPAGLLVSVRIESETGETLIVTTDSQWKASAKEQKNWEDVSFDDSSWADAYQAGLYGCGPWNKSLILPPARCLRTEFSASGKPIKHAFLYAAALGLYQLYLNGQHVNADYFSPGWTDYDKRIYYRTYDVTQMLREGRNAMGAVLADGWYAGYVGFGGNRNLYGKNLRLLSQLYIEYADGTSQIVASGPDWKGSLGPIQQADFLMGETYDARMEMSGWDRPEFDDASWKPVVAGLDEVHPKVQAAVSGPVVAFAKVAPVSVSEPGPGRYVFDMGQNFAGVVQIRVRGKEGQKITIRHAERLNPDGTIYTTNLRAAAATDTYICKGGGLETWQPYFTFHGFQYVELSGLDSKPSLDSITGLALSSDLPVTGRFACSDDMVNKLWSNAVWTMRMNFIDIPTDCPQRDERLGWTGDAQVYINTACWQNDVHAFFTKWITDLTDAQRADGQFPMYAPRNPAIGDGSDGGPAWADAGILCPWTIYKMYGDTRILQQHYESMKKFITFCEGRCTKDLLPPKNFHAFGDWLNINDDTPKEVIFMAYFGASTSRMAEMAEAIGKTNDAAEYSKLFERIKESFNRAYVQRDGKIRGDSQTAYVLALAYDLLEGDKKEQASRHLVRKIESANWHLSTGFVGTKDLMLVLSKIGRTDVAYRLLHNDTFPSWGFSIKHGATTIWERWNGWTPEQGFGDPGMNSFAHYSFGAVCQWIVENIGGIQTDGPAFKNIIIRPQPGGRLTWAKTSYRSIRGDIAVSWKKEAGRLILDVQIPANTTAMVYIPSSAPDQVQEGGKPLEEKQIAEQCARVQIGSGTYHFESLL